MEYPLMLRNNENTSDANMGSAGDNSSSENYEKWGCKTNKLCFAHNAHVFLLTQTAKKIKRSWFFSVEFCCYVNDFEDHEAGDVPNVLTEESQLSVLSQTHLDI